MRAQATGAQADDPKERLITASIDGIADQGYERVRLKDIAAIAGVTTGMIQHYFASREELLLAALERIGTDQIEAARRATDGQPDPWRRLEALLDQVAARPDTERRCAAWLNLCANAARDDRVRASLTRVTQEWRQQLTETVRAGFDAGIFTSGFDQAQLVDTLMAAIDGCELSIGSGAGVVDGPAARRLLLNLAAVLTGVDRSADVRAAR
jgi:AcrR family transcriptional regulator